MLQPLRPSSELPSKRTAYKVKTEDRVELVVEVAAPLNPSKGALLMCHPNPTGGGMMDSHVYKKAANRLPALADLTIVRFNTRGTTSEQGTSSGTYDQTKSEKYDVEAMLKFALDELRLEELDNFHGYYQGDRYKVSINANHLNKKQLTRREASRCQSESGSL